MKFSSGLANILPLGSQARQVAGSEGRTMITGPDMSLGASAFTQESSSCGGGAEDVVANAFEVGASPSSALATLLRFFGFLSPLKTSGLTISICTGRVLAARAQAPVYNDVGVGVGMGFAGGQAGQNLLGRYVFGGDTFDSHVSLAPLWASKKYIVPICSFLLRF